MSPAPVTRSVRWLSSQAVQPAAAYSDPSPTASIPSNSSKPATAPPASAPRNPTPPRPSSWHTSFVNRPHTSSHTRSQSDSSLGTVVHAVNEIVHVQGLHSASAGSLVRFTRSGSASAAPALGLVMAVQAERVIVALLNEGHQHSIVTTGDRVSHTRGDVPTFPVGPSVLGRMLSPLAQPCDNQPPLSSSLTHLPTLSPSSPSLTNRASPTHFISTGYKHLDFFHPLTRGLRIGLLGDKHTGKTTLATDALAYIINQSRSQPEGERVYGVYVCVGKKANEVARVRERLVRAGVMDSCVVVVSSDGDSMGSQYLAPFSGCTVADWLRDEGKHVVIVYDDLVTHGAICTGIDRSVGYPALSTSYLHARLLERTASINGGGSVI